MGTRVWMLRQRRGWTQEGLGERSDLDRRTIQRIESGEYQPSGESIAKLAQAFETDVSHLSFGFTAETLSEFEEMYLCPHCGAPLESRTLVNHEYGDVEYEEFACGHTRGWRFRPCPKDPRFPRWEDHELHHTEQSAGGWVCYATGKTEAAQAVGLANGFGETREQAERLVRRSYVQARHGPAAAEAEFPPFG